MHRFAHVGLATALCFVMQASAPNAAPLAVEFVHSGPLDAACAFLGSYTIDSAWRAELDRRLPELQDAWARDGGPVLERALRLAGRRLHGLRPVQLTLCDVPSSSMFGTVVNARHALASFTGTPVSMRYKAIVAAHELLHSALADADLSASPMLAAHARERQRVRNHLHLFALLKAAMIELGREDALDEIWRVDRGLPDGAYGRAWELVNASPNRYLAYVEEVRASR